ncbi:hypothetical protein Taro_026793 [Colocasia esculenta]|uniref:SPX domain-containing protein n=1 Tax=Colocasia esculenta TaxID=4460 RepID=A0A843VCB2_COLES|nr:hypothetical protein [Colocasia esculenta]
MKFGKRLKRQMEETLPEWRDKFLSYKDLKKLVRLVSVLPGKAEADFVRLLNAEVDKFNAFFIEQEEDFVIRQKDLRDRIRSAQETVGPRGCRPSSTEYAAEMGTIRKGIVDLHGEMVLLVNYSNINYTGERGLQSPEIRGHVSERKQAVLAAMAGLAKILKKYDKRTGALLRLPFIEKVLTQPFFTTDLISRLVRECESTVDAVFPVTEEDPDQVPARGRKREATAAAERSILRNAVAALVTMQEMRRGSSTYGHFSLPPLPLSLPDPDLVQSLQLPSPIPTQ